MDLLPHTRTHGIRFPLLIILLSCLNSALPCNATLASLSANETDRLSLLAFKEAISDSSGALRSWNDSFPYCQWRGIACGRRHPGRITALNLASLGLSGYISPWVANLTFLRRIDLSSNQLFGIIPPQVGSLFRLRHLFLQNNSLSGNIPSNLSHCSDLEIIFVRFNRLEGEIPMGLGSLSKLARLTIRANQMTGSIPSSLGNLSSTLLEGLELEDNALVGGIPSTLGRLTNMMYLAVGQNNLSGMLPHSLFNLSNLELFQVENNQLSGTLPPDLGILLPKLKYLAVAGNKFEGNIPDSLSNLSLLQRVDFGDNMFRGTIPGDLGGLRELYDFSVQGNRLEAREPRDWDFLSSMTNCTHLKVISLVYNELGGSLPKSIANLSASLQLLFMGGNHISGSIPMGMENIRGLLSLSMGGNLFSGSIPSTVGMLNNLVILELTENLLSGEIPLELGNLTQLSELSLDHNSLSGAIPTTFGGYQHLQKLDVSFNNLNGGIPEQLFTIFSLLKLIMSNNYMDGSLTLNIGHLINLEYLDLSVNRFSGFLPTALGDCQTMENLYLQGNSFEGTIPSSLKKLKGIVVMDFSINNLSGKIPEFLEGYQHLQYLNLSFNNFIGEVPKQGIFANVSAISLVGNQMICGGISALQLPTCASEVEKKRNGPRSLKFIVSITVVGLCLILCFIGYLYWMWKTKEKTSIASPSEVKYKMISYHDLVKATDGFSSSNFVGRGSFGSVYKGVLDNENIVAIKVFNIEKQGASKSFKSECEALRNIRHRNLVKILSICSSIDSRGNDFKAMVFEFFPNGSLEKWLHPEPNSEISTLDFAQRISIAADVASALDYLHNHCHSPIIHCDLKPSNVLLDGNMIAHVGDFGLARFILKVPSENLENQSSTIGVKGTIGYVAPEYGLGSPVSTYGDVYSFGILLLELFTAKRPSDDMFMDGWSLQKFVESAIFDKELDILDPHLILLNDEVDQLQNAQNNSGSSRERIHRCFVSLMHIGLNCAKESPRERIAIGDVVKEIHRIQEAYLGVARMVAS